MEHVLDNPAWNALISGNKNLSFGNDRAKYFDIQVSPFAALKENSAENFEVLREILPHDRPILFVTPVEMETPAKWILIDTVKGVQMVHQNDGKWESSEQNLVTLTQEHAPQMLALTKLTNPGPFNTRTIEFGHYKGIFDEDKLVAMAGQRLHAFNYTEISAVCTHPVYLGRGYAKQLLQYQINRIRNAGNAPYLHVRHDNDRAIKVYESLGFAARTTVHFYVLKKA
jgi:ribosomal protein S18 acetylase RimI-like enzyme